MWKDNAIRFGTAGHGGCDKYELCKAPSRLILLSKFISKRNKSDKNINETFVLVNASSMYKSQIKIWVSREAGRHIMCLYCFTSKFWDALASLKTTIKINWVNKSLMFSIFCFRDRDRDRDRNAYPAHLLGPFLSLFIICHDFDCYFLLVSVGDSLTK